MKLAKLSLLSVIVSLSFINTAYCVYNDFDNHYSLQGDKDFINELKRRGINPDFDSDDDSDSRKSVSSDEDEENSSFFDVQYKDNKPKTRAQLEEEYHPTELTGHTGLPDPNDPNQVEQYRRGYQYNVNMHLQKNFTPDVRVNKMQLKPFGLTMTEDYHVIYLDPRLNAKYGVKVRSSK